MIILAQEKAVLVIIWWYWVSMGWYWVSKGHHCLALGGTESVCIAHRNLKWSYDQTVLLVWLESNGK